MHLLHNTFDSSNASYTPVVPGSTNDYAEIADYDYDYVEVHNVYFVNNTQVISYVSKGHPV